jgi:N-acetylglucosaminyl-diphospho-decaprenol L-rhamnosyltransferase
VAPPTAPLVDVVIVAYNSAPELPGCVSALTPHERVNVIVVDNASPDDTEAALEGLDATLVRAGRNGGFAAGTNLGARTGSAPYVLLLNPDARLAPADLDALIAVLDAEPGTAIAAPRILEEDGSLAFSQRRFPRRRSTFAQALFLHRLWPNADWADELVRDPDAYTRAGAPDWVSGACLLIRRSVLEQLGGLDESFFLYCEDIDLCARTREAGWDIRFAPAATAHHEGGASAPREQLMAVLARNRVVYARKHGDVASARAEAAGVALGHVTHALTSVLHPAARRGHLLALRAVLGPPAAWRETG